MTPQDPSKDRSNTRREVIEQVKLHQPCTIDAIAVALGLSYETARHHVSQLETAGLVTRAWARDKQVGRPEGEIRLTSAGEHAFTKAYDELAVAVLAAVESVQGPGAVREVLAHIADAKVAALRPRVEGASLAERLRVLKDVYLPDDPYTRVVDTESGPVLEERNCPFLSVAMQRPALCSLTVSVLSRVLGYRVKRECSFQRGDGCCRFRVQLDKPVPPGFRFGFESDGE